MFCKGELTVQNEKTHCPLVMEVKSQIGQTDKRYDDMYTSMCTDLSPHNHNKNDENNLKQLKLITN